MSLISLTCQACGANLTVDSNKETAVCEFCGKAYIVKDAIVHNYINNTTNIVTEKVDIYNQKDFEIKGGKLIKYNGESPDVIIPNGVTAIKGIGYEGGAFTDSAIESVKIPSSIKEINKGAFAFCKNLRNVDMPNDLVKIGYGAFEGCTALEKIDIPENVQEIEDNAFKNCISLKSIVIPNSVTKIGKEVFRGCTRLSNITLSKNIHTISTSTFCGCESLEKIVLPNGITHIEDQAFVYCSSLQSVYIPQTTKYVEPGTFRGCCSLIEIKFPQHLNARDIYIGTNKGANLLKEERRKNGVCLECGGEFIGIFFKKCQKCGKNKNY